MQARRAVLVLFGLAAAGCYDGASSRGIESATDGATEGASADDGDGDGSGSDDGGTGSELASGPTGLRLLTLAQYENSIIDVLGDVAVEPVGQWRSSIAAAQGGVSPAGVEDYEAAAFEVTAQVFGDPALGMAAAGCTPQVAADDPCVATVIETLGRRAWRRPLSDDELARYRLLAFEVAELLGGDPWLGLQHAVAGILQSPHFLYRVELGEPIETDPAHVRLDAYELASRLSYLAWNTTPDDELLDAAAAGELDDATGLKAQLDRLLESPRAREGTVQVFVDAFDLDALLSLQKDPVLLPAFSPTVGPAMREELVRVIGDTVLDRRDLRRLFDTQTGYVDAELASLYGISGDFGSAPTEVTLPEVRGGLLTLAGFLAIHSGEASTSPTKRGLAVRLAIMCQTIPPPPPGVDAELPEPEGGEVQTKRQQLESHATDPSCAGCHTLTDPIGLALENFDALGGYRATDNGLAIDPSGDLEGQAFADAAELGTRLAEHPLVAECVIRNLYRYAVGHVEQPDEEATIDLLVESLQASGYDLREAIEVLATSDGFRIAKAAQEEGQ